MTKSGDGKPTGIHVGRDGYLFLSGGAHGVFSLFTGRIDPPSTAARILVENLEARKAWCDATARLFRMVIFPEKCVALRDMITEDGPFSSLYQRCYASAVEGSPAAGFVRYPIGPLDGQPRAFHRTDTHYGVHGELAVIREITQDIFPDLQDQFAGLTYPQIVQRDGFIGDLGRKLPTPASETQELMQAPATTRMFASNGMKAGNDGMMDLLESPDALTDKTLLIFGDSFFRQLLKHLCVFYRRVIFCRSRFFHYEMVDAFRPDHVYCGVAERYLSDVAPDAQRPHFLSYPLALGRPIEPDEGFAALWRRFVDPAALIHAPASATDPGTP